MRLAHLSDLHLLSLEGAVPFRLLNKRLTGYLNLRFHRKSIHKPSAVRAAADAIRAARIDHVAVTGDLSNLALEVEFELVRQFLADDLGMPADAVSLVPGNHDVYTGGAFRSKRFERTFAAHLTSDLPELTPPGDVFPYVRFRGAAAIIGLSTAVPRPPFVASGRLGERQLSALRRILTHPDVKERTPVILQHHPVHNPKSALKRRLEGLDDAEELTRVLACVPRGVLLHGHLHRRVHRHLKTDGGSIEAVGATSASLLHEDGERRGGFNVVEIADDGAIQTIEWHRLRAGLEGAYTLAAIDGGSTFELATVGKV